MLPGFCPHCNRWLGRDNTLVHLAMPISLANLQTELNVANAVGEMLAIAPNLNTFPNREHMASSIAQFIRDDLGGNTSEAARRMQISRRSIIYITKGIQAPELGTLLRICEALDVSPIELLTGITQKSLAFTDLSGALLPKKSRRKPREFLEAIVRSRLVEIIEQNEVPPPTLADVATQLKYDKAYLKYRVPDLCQIIIDRHRQYEIEEKALGKVQFRKAIREKTLDLHNQGIYPALHKVAAGGVGAAFKDKELRLYWKELLRELGYHI